jgi:pyruvate dehydrogenase E1 component alpha subunit
MNKEILENRMNFLRRMVLIRTFEEKAKELFSEGLVRGSIHLYKGQEAVAVGVCSQLRADDWITSTHRGHGHCIAKGVDIRYMFAELMGKQNGCCKGKGGSMHIADVSKGMLGASAIVGSGIPLAVGAALTSKYKKLGRIAVAFFGDGASNNGVFHECLNIASLWKLPVIFICENNLYGITVPVGLSTSVKNIAERAGSYSMPGEVVDGSNVVLVAEAAKKMMERARRGEGPSLIECKTYRYEGHWVGDPIVYRTREEEKHWMTHQDPINMLYKNLEQERFINEEDFNKLAAEAHRQADDAVLWAREQSPPAASTALTDVYSGTEVLR